MKTQDDSEAFESLKEYLRIHFNAKVASGGREIVKRCHFCGDSKDQTHAHLYIGYKDGLIRYNCFKCGAKGIVDKKFLYDLGCYDERLVGLITDLNKKLINPIYTRSGGVNRISVLRNIVFPPIKSDDQFAYKKLDYLSRRFGYKLTFQDMYRFKAVFNLKDFLDFNGLVYSRSEELMDLINKFFVGFLSIDCRYAVLRRLIPEGKLPKAIDSRYIIYNVLNSEGGYKYYVIPTSVDLSKPIDIHIAEGAFDIISVYLNVAPLGTNGVFMAVVGNSYANAVQFLLSTYGFMGFNLHIYPDADIDDREMYYIKKRLAPYTNISIYIHRNGYKDQKDYGVSKDLIVDNVIKI